LNTNVYVDSSLLLINDKPGSIQSHRLGLDNLCQRYDRFLYDNHVVDDDAHNTGEQVLVIIRENYSGYVRLDDGCAQGSDCLTAFAG
jgi:hypothetical protein